MTQLTSIPSHARTGRKEIVPLVDRSEELPPPSLVVVVGPKGCGKSTLIRSLVKYYSGQNLSDVLGPVTVVCGKRKRVTFFECPADDLCAMLDLGACVRALGSLLCQCVRPCLRGACGPPACLPA